MKQQSRFIYNRTLKLGPAIGDWTTIQLQDSEVNDIQVTQVQQVNFDSLPRDKMKNLHIQHYRLAESIALQLSKDMDIKIELHTIHATQVSYQDFLDYQEDKVVQSDFCLPNGGRINLIMDWELAEMMVNRLTGGKGEESGEQVFTDLEKVVLEAQMESIFGILSQSWNAAFSPEKVSVLFNMGPYVYDKKISLREAYVVFSFYLFFGKGNLHKVVMAYPNDVLRQLMLGQESNGMVTSSNIQLDLKTLTRLKVPVQATLGKTELTMSQLKRLDVGDIVTLDSKINQPLEVNVGKNTILPVQPGVHNNKVSLQILSSIRKSQRMPERTEEALDAVSQGDDSEKNDIV